MAKITRKTQKIFGSTAGSNQIAKIGSLAAGAPVRTTGALADPDTIQSLSEYLSGLFAVVLGSNSPAIEDMNALFWLITRQLGYVYQTGIPEWDTNTVYYIGSLVNDGNGKVYYSLTDNNSGNALTSDTNWKSFGQGVASGVSIKPTLGELTSITPYELDDGGVYLFDSTLSFSPFEAAVVLPPQRDGLKVTIKDIGGIASRSGQHISVYPNSGDSTIEGVDLSFVGYRCEADYGSWTFVCNDANWSII